jgi:hypothetical protein
MLKVRHKPRKLVRGWLFRNNRGYRFFEGPRHLLVPHKECGYISVQGEGLRWTKLNKSDFENLPKIKYHQILAVYIEL